MQKQLLTKEDIKRDLLKKLNKGAPLWIYLTVITLLSAVALVLRVVLLARTHADLPLEIFLLAALLAMFVWLLLEFYYLDLFRVKAEKFRILEETLYEKKREWIRYYRQSVEENSLYFRNFRIAVEDDVFSESRKGDTFYTVILRSSRSPIAVYRKDRYELDPELL